MEGAMPARPPPSLFHPGQFGGLHSLPSVSYRVQQPHEQNPSANFCFPSQGHTASLSSPCSVEPRCQGRHSSFNDPLSNSSLPERPLPFPNLPTPSIGAPFHPTSSPSEDQRRHLWSPSLDRLVTPTPPPIGRVSSVRSPHPRAYSIFFLLPL